MPSFWMLANNETQAGVSIYFVNEKIDAGDLCAQRTFVINPGESLHTFIKRSKLIAADLLSEVLLQLRKGVSTRKPLDLAEGSYYSWPDSAAVKRFRATGHTLW
jgi:methionyl-tRNA formyltransferase